VLHQSKVLNLKRDSELHQLVAYKVVAKHDKYKSQYFLLKL